MLPRISVVIPVFRRQRELGFALRSLEGEAHLIHEVIVIDDASPEPVLIEAPPGIAKKVRLERLERNSGSSAARQAGIALAEGELIAFLDSDDAWLPGKLAAQLPLVNASDNLVAVMCGWQTVDVDRNQTQNRIPRAAEAPELFASGCWFSPGSTAIVPRAAFVRTGGLDPKLRRLEDLDWYLRFSLGGGRIQVSPFIGALVRRAAKSNRKLVGEAAARMRHRFAHDPRASREVRRRLDAWLDAEQAFAAWTEGYRMEAVTQLARSMVRSPRTRLQMEDWWRIEPPKLSHAEAKALLGM